MSERNVTVRKYQEKDKENLRRICIATGPEIKSEKHRLSQLALYCDYFAEVEPENIFVAANEDDEAVGYILCCTDYLKFKKAMKSHYLKPVRRYSFFKYLVQLGELSYDKPLVKKYPAFLHIDIFDGYQRLGLGHRLMNALMAHLKENNIPAVMLGVGSSNEKGVSFYKKYGFHVIKQGPGFIKYGYYCKDYKGG